MKSVAFQGNEVTIPIGQDELTGELTLPPQATGVVVFAHGSGSSRHSPRNQFVAGVLQEANLGTLLFDLLTPREEEAEYYTRHLRFDIHLLAARLVAATDWLQQQGFANDLGIGYFGSSTGAAAALVAAAKMVESIGAVVSRGGRPDLAGADLGKVRAPTLLIVGSEDTAVIELNEHAFDQLRCEKEMRLIQGATHLFEETGTLEEVSLLASEWFSQHLQSANSKKR